MARPQPTSERRTFCPMPPASAMAHKAAPPLHSSAQKDKNRGSLETSHLNSSTDSLPYNGRSKLICCPINNMKPDAMPQYDLMEYESLPPAVRRKMFSSHERLRMALAQHKSSQSPLKHTRNMSSTSVLFSRPRCSQDVPRCGSSRGKLRKAPPNDAFVLSQGDAQWFINLPDAIKRKHFTQEERLLLAGKCQSVIMDATDETLFRMGHLANRSCGTLDSSTSTASRGTSEELRSPTDVQDSNLSDWRDSFRWLDDDDDLDLRLNLEEYHQSYLNKPLPPTPTSACSRRRTLSLSSRPTKVQESPLGRISSTEKKFATRFSMSSRRPSFAQSRNASMDHDAAYYYQDQEARLKLRVYLASAQKFDEAVEFGFPSTPENGQEKGMQSQTFLFSDDGPFDGYESKNSNGRHESRRHLRRFSLSTPFPRKQNIMHNHYPVELPGNREMTLRMTLTRPDLRDDEGSSHGLTKDDPLALEPLQTTRDSDSGFGSFEIPPWCRDPDPGLVKKIWRRVRNPMSSRKA